MNEAWQIAKGVVVRGHGVASGRGADRRYGAGTLELQRPCFAALGLDLSGFFDGTLNVDLAPLRGELAQPSYTFRQVRWTERHPPEDFSFSRCQVRWGGGVYEGWIYTPHPETKAAHFQLASMVEILVPFMEGIAYGDEVELWVKAGELALREPAGGGP